MPSGAQLQSIEWWLEDVRTHFIGNAPALVPLFDTYAAEALFARRFIASDLEQLPPGAKILEVGAGSLLLACQLIREGFDVTGLEPIASGFSHFEQMQQMVLTRANALDCPPQILQQSAEEYFGENIFDYVFSINVMEHVKDVSSVITNIARSLNVGAYCRFTCPNYLFPYEPHFNIPTFFSKKITEKLMGKKIFNNKYIPDPIGTWGSLNWIDVGSVHKILKKLPWLKVTFNRSLLVTTLERIGVDQEFSNRRSPFARKLLIILVTLRLHLLFRYIPAVLQPIMDCKIQKL
jgi:2-polyprenyl-3-methyl-5-hydroxy-6-metoxy-1,4-benzoquinol methylase